MTSLHTSALVVALMSSAGAQGLVSGQLQPRGASGVLPTGVVKLTSPAAQDSDLFGQALALAGGELFVGAPGDDTAGVDVGALHVHRRTRSGWVHEQALFPGDALSGWQFGWSAAHSAGTLAVGAPGGFNGTGTGAVYVFDRSGDAGGWVEAARLTGSGTPLDARFGAALALLGDTLVVGAPAENNTIGAFVGNTYVFERNELGTWVETAKLFPFSAPNGALFGASVALTADTILVGAPYLANSFIPGSVSFFDRGPGGWAFDQQVFGPISVGRDRFGSSVALTPAHAWIGSPRDSVPPLGLLSTLERAGPAGPWTGLESVLSPEPAVLDRFGGQVSRSGSRVAVGATGQDGAGAVFVYDVGPLPVFRSKVVAPDGVVGDAFGSAVALRGSTLAVGASSHDAGAVDDGAVWVFDVP